MGLAAGPGRPDAGAGRSQAAATLSRPPLTFFCELAEAPLLALMRTPGLLDELRALGASVSMACLDRGAARAQAIRTLTAAGIPVTAWLVLTREQGYFATADNAAAVAACADEIVAWIAAERLEVRTLGIDVEMEIEHMEALASRPWRLALPALRGTLDPARAERAEADYARLVGDLRAGGFAVETYQVPPVVDGRAAGSGWLARAFGMLDVRADREVLMLYSSALPVGGAWVESYARDAEAIALGVTGGGTVAVRNMTWEALRRDLDVAARTSKPLYLFSLEGCVERGYLPRLRALDWASPDPLPRSTAARGLDALRAVLRGGLRADAALLRALRRRPPDAGGR